MMSTTLREKNVQSPVSNDTNFTMHPGSFSLNSFPCDIIPKIVIGEVLMLIGLILSVLLDSKNFS